MGARARLGNQPSPATFLEGEPVGEVKVEGRKVKLEGGG